MFSRIGKEVTIAVKKGGPDPANNPALRRVMQNARAANMPKDKVEAAIKKASGQDQADYEEILYEGYAPHGVAVLVETATDNRNRTAADIRSIFSKAGGQLAGAGSVAWQFEPLGLVSVSRHGQDPDEIALLAIDAGAVDVDTESDPLEISTAPTALQAVREALEAAGVKVESAELTMQAKAPITIDAAQARQNLRLIEALEDHDDVQRVTTNVDIPEDILAEIAG